MTAGTVQTKYRSFSGLNKEVYYEYDANDANDSTIQREPTADITEVRNTTEL